MSSRTTNGAKSSAHGGGGALVLDVGGTLFKTTTATLLSIPGTYFERILQGSKHKDEAIFIDRDPEFFIFILNYLRDGPAVVLPDKENSRARVQQEAYFYGLEGLLDLIARPEAGKQAAKNATDRMVELEFFDITGTTTVCEERLGVLRSTPDSRLAQTFEGDTSKMERVDALRAPELLKYLKFGTRALPTTEVDANYWAGLRNEAKFQKIPDLVKYCGKYTKVPE